MSFETNIAKLFAPAPAAKPQFKITMETNKKFPAAARPKLTINPEGDASALEKAKSAVRRQRGVIAAFGQLSPLERRKVSALVLAGQHGGKVTDHFKALTPGSFKGAIGTAEQLKKGLALAKTQKLKLDAATW